MKNLSSLLLININTELIKIKKLDTIIISPHMVGKGKNMHDDIMILKGLIDLGFSDRQSKVYLALYKKPDANLSDLQKLTGIRQDKLSEIMNNLIREGYCSEKTIERRKYFNVTNPKTAIGISVKKKKKSLENSYKALEDMYNNDKEIKEPFEYIEVFHGNDNIHHNYCQLVKNSKKEILAFTREPFAFHSPEKQKEQEDVINNFLARKGVVKSIYEKTFCENNPDIRFTDNYDKVEIEVRIAENLPLKLLIFDRRVLMISDAAPLNISNELRMVLIKQQTIINAFVGLFNFFWQQSIDAKIWKAQINKMKKQKKEKKR